MPAVARERIERVLRGGGPGSEGVLGSVAEEGRSAVARLRDASLHLCRLRSGTPGREVAKVLAAGVLWRTGLVKLALGALARIDGKRRVAVLTYHKVCPGGLNERADGTHVSNFDDHLRVLGRLFRMCGPDEALAALGGEPRGNRYPECGNGGQIDRE